MTPHATGGVRLDEQGRIIARDVAPTPTLRPGRSLDDLVGRRASGAIAQFEEAFDEQRYDKASRYAQRAFLQYLKSTGRDDGLNGRAYDMLECAAAGNNYHAIVRTVTAVCLDTQNKAGLEQHAGNLWLARDILRELHASGATDQTTREAYATTLERLNGNFGQPYSEETAKLVTYLRTEK